MKRKRAGESTSSVAWQKQPGDGPIGAKTSDTHTSQAADKKTLAEPQPTTKGENERG
jgi:hypothetical protein